MNEWIRKQIDSGFSDFKGLSINARIPMKDSMVNELLAETLQSLASPSTSAAPGDVDLKSFLRFVERAEVKASEGVIALEVDIRI